MYADAGGVSYTMLATPSLVFGGVGHVCQEPDGLRAGLAVHQLQVAADKVLLTHVPLVTSLYTGILERA